MKREQPERVAEFIEVVRTRLGEDDASTARRIVDWAHATGLRDWFPGDADSPLSYKPVIIGVAWEPTVIGVNPNNGHVYFQGGDIKRGSPFKAEGTYAKLLEELHQIPQVTSPPKDEYPHLLLSDLADPGTWDSFFNLMTSVVSRIKRFDSPAGH